MSGAGKICPVILAAGASRLAEPKALARFGDCTALEIAIANCDGLEPPIVVLGSEAARVREFVPVAARVVVNRRWRRGQMSSLLAALKHVPRATHVLLYPVDYPLLAPDVIHAVVAGFQTRNESQSITVPRFRSRGGQRGQRAWSLRRSRARCRAGGGVSFESAVEHVDIETIDHRGTTYGGNVAFEFTSRNFEDGCTVLKDSFANQSTRDSLASQCMGNVARSSSTNHRCGAWVYRRRWYGNGLALRYMPRRR